MITLLIVDDHAVLRAGLRSRLRAEPDIGEIWEAADADAAVVKARAYRPRVVLLDLLMPRMSGYDAIPCITEVSPDSRIVVCSAMSGTSAVRQALAAGAAGYLAKRAPDRDLLDGIRRVAEGGTYVDPAVGFSLAGDAAGPALDELSPRERDVLHLLALGYTNQEIAHKLFISVRTVDSHRAHILRKLRMTTRAELVLYALSTGLIGPA
jgi:two-component system, NarL family, response regulator NreC